jgi:hypothetical protein
MPKQLNNHTFKMSQLTLKHLLLLRLLEGDPPAPTHNSHFKVIAFSDTSSLSSPASDTRMPLTRPARQIAPSSPSTSTGQTQQSVCPSLVASAPAFPQECTSFHSMHQLPLKSAPAANQECAPSAHFGRVWVNPVRNNQHSSNQTVLQTKPNHLK